MKTVVMISQIIVALGTVNVWILRFGKATNWRGGNAGNLTEDFQFYGLPGWCMGVIGFLKLLLATLLIAGIWFPDLTKPAAVGMAVLMLGAVSMHARMKDRSNHCQPFPCPPCVSSSQSSYGLLKRSPRAREPSPRRDSPLLLGARQRPRSRKHAA